MADNIPLPNTAINVATDEIAGVHYPRTKITLGAEGANGGDVSAANPLPVALDATSLAALENINVTVDNLTVGLTDAQLRASAVSVSGTVELGATSLAALENVTATISNPTTSVSVSNFPATQAVSGTVTANTGLTQPLTDTQLRATAVPVSIASVPSHAVTNAGTFAVQVTSAPTTAVTGTFWQATQPVSGPLTDTQLRATAVPISGTVTANTGLTQPLTDTQLRASAVPVSLASVPSHAVTNAGTFAVQVTSAPTTAVTGTFWQATQPVSIAANVNVISPYSNNGSVPSNAMPIGGSDGTLMRTISTDTTGKPNVNVASSVLPTGAATETTVATLSTEATLVALKALQEEIKAQTEVVEYALMALLDKIAMPDRYDRTRVSLSGADGSEANGPYYGLNTATVGDNVTGRLYSRLSEPWNMHDAGTTRIYSNVIVS